MGPAGNHPPLNPRCHQRHPCALRELPLLRPLVQHLSGPAPSPTRPLCFCPQAWLSLQGHRGQHRYCRWQVGSWALAPQTCLQRPPRPADLGSAVQARLRSPGPCGSHGQGQQRRASAHVGTLPIWAQVRSWLPGPCWAPQHLGLLPVGAGGPPWRGSARSPGPQVPRSGSFSTLPSHSSTALMPVGRLVRGLGPGAARHLPGLGGAL